MRPQHAPAHLPTPLYWLTAGLLAGQAAAAAAYTSAWRAIGVLGAVAALAALAIAREVRSPAAARSAARRDWRARAGRACRTWSGPAAAALLAAVLGHWQMERLLHPLLADDHVARFVGERLLVRARVADRPTRRPGKTRLLLEVTAVRRGVNWRPAEGRLLVTVRTVQHAWQRGDRLEAMVEPRQPRNFGNPGEFDFAGFLARRGIYATAFASSDAAWERTPAVAGVGTAFESWRDRIAQTLEASLDPTTAAIVGALLIGDAIALPADVRDRYARAGVSHVLSISGLHVGLVAGAAYALLRWLLGRSERALLSASVPKLAMAISLLPLAFYSAIAGANVATLRAELMGLLVVAAVLLDRPRDWLAPLAAAALAISLSAPGALAEISFQLSFVAVLAIVLGGPPIVRWWSAWEEAHLVRLRGAHWRWIRWVVLSQAVTACAMLGTAPLTAWHFNQVSLIAFVANPLVVPLLGLVCVGGGLVAAVAVVLAPRVAAMLFQAVGLLVRVADWVVRLCASLPGASLHVITPSLLELTLLYGALGGLLLPRWWRRIVLSLCLSGLSLDLALAAQQRYTRDSLQITFVSVGQGDCAVIEFPGSAVMVIDGGGLSGDFDVGRMVVAPFLWRRRIGHVDTLVLSHPDFDHYGGLTFLAGAFDPEAFWWNGGVAHGPRYEALWRTLREAGVRGVIVRDGFRRTIGGVEVYALHPGEGLSAGDNDSSLTLRLRYGPTTVLFPGDLEAEGERALLEAHGGEVRSTLLKAPHHGSRTSSSPAFLDAVAPEIAIVSAGSNNRFGFPHQAVLERYRERNVELWRTDRDGAVTVRIAVDGTIQITAGSAAPRSK
jgi:competence protein ComEC